MCLSRRNAMLNGILKRFIKPFRNREQMKAPNK
jgi:hypothetical protein